MDTTHFLLHLHFVSPPSVCSNRLTTKIYSQWCSPSPACHTLPPPYAPILVTDWSKFWQLSLSHSCRNVWYWYFHKKPHIEPFYIGLCLNTFNHRLVIPRSLLTTSYLSSQITVWQTYIAPSSPTVSTDTLRVSIYTFHSSLPMWRVLPEFSLLALSATFESIWLCQWGFCVQQLSLQHESNIQFGTPHSPAPSLSVESPSALHWQHFTLLKLLFQTLLYFI